MLNLDLGFKLTLNSKPDDYMVVCNFGWNQQTSTHFGSNEPNKYLVLYTNLQWKIEVLNLNLKTFFETFPQNTPPPPPLKIKQSETRTPGRPLHGAQPTPPTAYSCRTMPQSDGAGRCHGLGCWCGFAASVAANSTIAFLPLSFSFSLFHLCQRFAWYRR
jgi:hypothetical protein